LILGWAADAASMAISGIVITLADPGDATSLIPQLSSQPEVTVGEQRGRRLALVLEVADGHDEAAVDRIRLLPGVVDVSIAAIHFLEPLPSPF